MGARFSSDPALLRSADGGKTFKLVYFRPVSAGDNTIRIKHVPGTDTIYTYGSDVSISTDRGLTWKFVGKYSAINNNEELFLFEGNPIYVYTKGDYYSPLLYKKTDAGFQKIELPRWWSYVDLQMVSPTKGYAFVRGPAQRNQFYRTVDGAATWTEVVNNGEPLDSIVETVMINDQQGYGRGYGNKLYKTMDGGATWLRIIRKMAGPEPINSSFVRWKFTGTNYCWIARHQVLEGTTNGGGLGLRECSISSFSPAAARKGASFIVSGDNFSMIDSVTLGGVKAAAWQVLDKTKLRVTVGEGASGDVIIYTPVNTVTLGGFRAYPAVSDIYPKTGTTNTRVTIAGTNVNSITQIKVGNVLARGITKLDNNNLQFSVPYTTNGTIQIISPDTVITLHNFTYRCRPTINSVTPLEGPAGSIVTITGTGFSRTSDSNKVCFGTLRANIVSSSTTEIKVKVPAGAAYAPISVANGFLTGSSAAAFSVTFPNGGKLNPNTFAAPRDLNPGNALTRPGKAVTADFDGDGKPDLIVADRTSNAVVISGNNSNGADISFQDQLTLHVGPAGANGLYKVIPADINSDGKIDFSIANLNNKSTYIYLNKSTPGNFSFEAVPPIAGVVLDVADINQDGRLDLLQSVNGTGVIRSNKSEADTFAFEENTHLVDKYFSTATPNAITIPLSGRAVPTVIFYDANTGEANMYRNNSLPDSLGFQFIYFSGNNITGDPIAGDGNKDGFFDLGVHSKYSVNVSYSTGRFGQPAELNWLFGTSINDAYQVSLQDMDGDGKADIIHGRKGTNKIYLYHNTFEEGTTTPAFSDATALDINSSGPYFTLADLNGDGRKDMIILDTVRNTLILYQNNASRRPYIIDFSPTVGKTGDTIRMRGVNFGGTTRVMLGNRQAPYFKVENDGAIRFSIGDEFNGEISVTNPSGSDTIRNFEFARVPRISSLSPSSGPVGTEVTIKGSNFSPIATENNVNFGGVAATVISATDSSIKVKVPAYTSTASIIVTTNGRMGEYTDLFKVTFSGPRNGFSIATFDLNLRLNGRGNGTLMDMDNDGKQDIITHDNDNLILHHNNSTPGKMLFDAPFFISIRGDGSLNPVRDTFVPGITFNPPLPLSNPAVMDLNNDGKADIVIFNPDDNMLYVYLNNSTHHNFSFKTPYKVSSPEAYSLSIHDFDGDGKPDIIHALNTGFRVFRNISKDSFSLAPGQAMVSFRDANSKNLAWGDINLDGKLDAMDGEIAYYNRSVPGKLEIWGPGITGFKRAVTALYDLNNDGAPDRVVVEGDNGGRIYEELSLYKNDIPAGINDDHTTIFTYQNGTPVYHWANQLAAGDFDGNGMTDFILNHTYYDGYNELLENASTADTLKLLKPVPVKVGPDGAGSAAVGDLDGDSKPDLVIFGNSDCGSWVCRNRYDEVINIKVCSNSDTSITSLATGSNYQWQIRKTTGDFINLVADTVYADVLKQKLIIKKTPENLTGYTYRCLVDGKTQEMFGLEVTPNTHPSLSLQNIMGESFCPGQAITLNATATNAGTTPVFQWFIDDSIRFDSTGPLFRCDTFTRAHSVHVRLISKGVCPDKAFLESQKEKFSPHSNAFMKATLEANSTVVCKSNDTDRFVFDASINIMGAGDGPVYKWYYNGSFLPGEVTSTLTKTGVQQGDSIHFIVTPTSGVCIAGKEFRSNTVKITPGSQLAANAKLSYSPPLISCIATLKPVLFTSKTVEKGSTVSFYSSNGQGAFWLMISKPFYADSLLFYPGVPEKDVTLQYFCKVTPPTGSCQQPFITDTLNITHLKPVKLEVKTDGDDLVALNAWPGSTYLWKDATIDTTSNPAINTGLLNRFTPSTSGIYYVIAVNGACATQSDYTTFVKPAPRVEIPILKPNPVQNSLVIGNISPADNWATLEILDSYGNVQMPAVTVSGMTSVTIDVSKLNDGMYYAVLKNSSGKNQTIRFIKMK
ncbi:FG-GAP-like repeat-containing protein [Chitinophaga nivalis]|uniref:FG-GAP-like repeat-containing protein n=1 Tax=Chitinophaga nivalis TaxID=2991709 RepID=A0ABT3IHB4_9BACT|nr:FG-GAP-like repeat-containing protein [Chitinophaga nivalis]MCW3483333.1 FG-GAP-like repeat-containing protein [Chitinophaga nivalis]